MTAAPALAPTLAQAALILAKSTLLLGAAAGGARALRRGSAAARHLVWALALGGLMALPALVLLLPDWKPALLAILRPPGSAAAWTAASIPAVPASPHPLLLLAAAVWAAGALVVLGRLGMGLHGVRKLARAAEPVTDPRWTELLERFAAAVGVRRPVALLRSREAAMPLTWGAFRPAILLPAEADGWSAKRRRVVLLHELAHVARRDCLMQLGAEICCAVYWFHPGAWWAARQMRVEREQACDDLVLSAGARASDYAGHLLDVARAYRAPALAAAIAMARPSHLEGRVRAVLEATRDRRAVTGRTAAICAGAVLLATLPLAAVAPSERTDAPQGVAWRMPGARTWNLDPATGERLSIRGSAEVIRAPRPAAVAPAPAPARSAPAAPKRTPRRPRQRAPEPRPAPTVRLASGGGGVTATVSGNRVRAVISVPRGVQVRVEGHGVRATTSRGQLRVEADLDALNRLAAQLSRHAVSAADCPKARAERANAQRKLGNDARRVAMGQKRDLGLRLLGEVSGGVTAESDAVVGDSGGA
ncbi:M56 family metallopeptidase [Longimicrobium sp.]|uniref:M56 family metallopeptidase n=1 Tax=Longimicrobium sp. TaxID=2029185 RepID=UPI002C4DF05D|nr:M56 family metallopeptidase [Longimicrobium sp.]HSU13979.1 M56 family metallopeptidase [Longimicrobium sp.]